METVIIQEKVNEDGTREGVTKIGDFAFQGCTSLKNIDIPQTVTSIGSTCFGSCTALESITIPGSVKTIPSRLVSACTNIKEIVLNEGITTIKAAAFEYCNNITEITIPKSVTSLNSSCFNGCSKLKNIGLEGNDNYKFENGLLLSKNGDTLYYAIYSTTQLNIPSTVITLAGIGSSPNLQTIEIPATVETINTIFPPESIKAINIDVNNPNYASINGNLYDKNIETLIRYCSNDSTVTFPETVKTIKSRAFTGQSNIKNLNLPEKLTAIGDFFLDGTSVTSLYIHENINSISTNAFSNVDITISEDNQTYKSEQGTYVLSKDGTTLVTVSKNLEAYNIPSSVKKLGRYCFYSKERLKTISLPSTITQIGELTFDACTNLQKIDIPSSVTAIGSTAFSRCDSLTQINIDKKDGEITGEPWGAPYGDRAVFWKK